MEEEPDNLLSVQHSKADMNNRMIAPTDEGSEMKSALISKNNSFVPDIFPNFSGPS